MIYETLPVNNYRGNNNAVNFDFDFYIENESQLKVYLFDENSIKFELENNVDYTINEVKNAIGSYITFPIAGSRYGILNDKQKISLELSLPISQETQYNNSSLLNLEALEYSLDYLTRLVQIIARKISLCVKVEECSEVTPDKLIDDIFEKTSNIVKKIEDAHNLVLDVKETAQNANDLAQEVFALNPADVDFSNITSDAKAIIKENAKTDEIISDLSTKTTFYQAAGVSMPSGKKIGLTYAVNTNYEAVEDGYFVANINNSGVGGIRYAILNNITSTVSSGGATYAASASSGAGINVMLPARKGDIVRIESAGGNCYGSIFFTYLEGCAPKEENKGG